VPQSQTRTYAKSDSGIALTVTTTGADGKQSTTTLTFKEDGKPYPATGNPEFDTVKVKRISTRTASSVQLKEGVKVGTGLRRVSKDGKTLTFKQTGTDASGAKYDNVSVYDRQ
jgi:membrane-bound inhibitor of C-type lysozyme